MQISNRQKREIIRSEFNGLLQTRKAAIDANVRVQAYKLQKEEDVAKEAINAYKNKLIYQIQGDFNTVMRKLGLRVVMEKLNLLTDLSERLSVFEDKLKAQKNIKKKFVDAILEEVDKTFDSVKQQVSGNVADSIVEVAPEKPGRD